MDSTGPYRSTNLVLWLECKCHSQTGGDQKVGWLAQMDEGFRYPVAIPEKISPRISADVQHPSKINKYS